MAPARLAHKEGSTRSHPRDMEASPCILFTYKQANYPAMQSGLYAVNSKAPQQDLQLLTLLYLILSFQGLGLH